MLDVREITDAIINKKLIDTDSLPELTQEEEFFIRNLNNLIDDYNLTKDNITSVETLIKILQDTTSKMERKTQHFYFLEQISRNALCDFSQSELFDSLLKIINEESGAHFSAIVIFHSYGEKKLSVFVKNAFDSSTDIDNIFPMWDNIAEYIMRQKKPMYIQNTQEHPIYENLDTSPFSCISLPLLFNDKILGVLSIGHKDIGFFPDDIHEIMDIIAKQISIILRNRMMLNQSFLPVPSFCGKLIQTMSEALFVLDLSYNIIFINKSAEDALEINRRYILNTPFIDLFAIEEEKHQFIYNLNWLLSNDKILSNLKYSFIIENKPHRRFKVSLSVIKDFNSCNNSIAVLLDKCTSEGACKND